MPRPALAINRVPFANTIAWSNRAPIGGNNLGYFWRVLQCFILIFCGSIIGKLLIKVPGHCNIFPTTLVVLGILSSCPRVMTMQCWKSQMPPPLSTRLRAVVIVGPARPRPGRGTSATSMPCQTMARPLWIPYLRRHYGCTDPLVAKWNS